MKFFENIIAKAEKKHLKEENMKYFLNCLTAESLREFEEQKAELKELSNFFYDNYDTLLRYKWHLSSDFTMMYKENSDAYLIISENGFVIDESREQSKEALEEEEALIIHGHDIVDNLFKYSCKYLIHHTQKWDTKEDIDHEAYELIGQSLGYLKEYSTARIKENENEHVKTK